GYCSLVFPGVFPAAGAFAGAPALGCLAMTNDEILSYCAFVRIFFDVSCALLAYGRPSMIFWERASPIPGSVINCCFVAEFRSIGSALGAFVAGSAFEVDGALDGSVFVLA